jgi:3-methyladenine DNA glycosylase AlkD
LGADDLAEIARLFKRISNETEALVAKLWPAITLVAKELLTRRALSEEEVDALIEKK